METPRAGGRDLAAHVVWGVLEGLEAGNEDVGKNEKAFWAFVVLGEAAKDASGHQLAQGGTGEIHILSVIQMRLLVQELDAIDQKAVY